jgi:hypothetical protein
MSNSRDDLKQLLVASINELLAERTGLAERVLEMDDQVDPMSKFGLDSKDGVDLACVLSVKLGFEVPDTINPLVDDARRKSRKIAEIVDLLLKMTPKSQGASHG